MNIACKFVETFSELDKSQVKQIEALLKELSPAQVFSPYQLRTAMMFGALCLASDVDREHCTVGMGLLTYRHTSLYSSATIEDVVVTEAYRGQGIARAIMEKLIDRARRYPQPLAFIELTSKPERVAANKLYDSMGFVPVEKHARRLLLSHPPT